MCACKVIDICKDASIKIGHKDIEGCHWLPLSGNSGGTKPVIVKFVNRKHPEDNAMGKEDHKFL